MGDLFDFLWMLDQNRQVGELRGRLDQVRLEHDLAAGDLHKVKELVNENLELKLRLGLLVRLLISKGVFTAQEYAALINEARPRPPSSAPNPSLQPTESTSGESQT
jgi:hypothetical protein